MSSVRPRTLRSRWCQQPGRRVVFGTNSTRQKTREILKSWFERSPIRGEYLLIDDGNGRTIVCVSWRKATISRSAPSSRTS